MTDETNSAKYIAELTDLAGNTTYPFTTVAAVLDFYDYVVSNGGDQSDIKGIKDFADGVKVAGKKVLVEGDIQPFDLAAGGIPGDDIFQINKSGVYYYTGSTKNVPHFEPIENSTGYILSVFQDDPQNGLLFFLGSFTYIEKYQGNWRTFFSPQPVKLWQGNAKPGDKIAMADNATNYRFLRFSVNDGPGSFPITLNSTQPNNNFFITGIGLTTDAKGLYVDESHLVLAADQKTFTFSDRKFGNILTGAPANTSACLVRIEGIR